MTGNDVPSATAAMLVASVRLERTILVPPPTRRIANRRMRFIPRDHPLVCPMGHRIREDDIALEHMGVRCKTRIGKQGECGALLWMLLIVPIGLRFVAEVTIDELRYMQHRGMNVEDVLVFLGATEQLVPCR